MVVNKNKTKKRGGYKRKYSITRKRQYIPSHEEGTQIEYVEEPIDFAVPPERIIGIDTHRHASSYQDPGGIYVTVHKEKYKMADQSGINKMGGLASINCSQHYTEACQERFKKAREHNAKIKNAEKMLKTLLNKRNKTPDDIKRIADLEKYLQHVRENVCGYCYADLGEKGLKGGTVTPRYKMQGEFIRSHILTKEEIPKFSLGEVIRINSHGDLESGEKGIIQFINYLNIAYQNPQSYFTLWTKQGKVVTDAFQRIGFRKPPNMTFIWSNTWIDKPILRPPHQYSFFDGVFNVVSYNFYKENKDWLYGVKTDPKSGVVVEVIKCERLCKTCRACYSGKTNFAIIEVLKDDARRYHNEIYSERRVKTNKKTTSRKAEVKPRKINIQKYIPIPVRFRV